MFTAEAFAKTSAGLNLRYDAALFDGLSRAYGEPTRFYHNQTHIAACLEALMRYAHLAERIAEVEMAIWFHDAIYDATRSDNEAQSAKWAVIALTKLGLESASVRRIEQMIIATATHAADALGNDAQLMLDIDLGILGARVDVFERYDADIRREYAWVPEVDYVTRRQLVLATFLEREAIYKTAPLHDALEAQARENLARKIAQLKVMSATH